MKSLAELHEFYRTELVDAIRSFEARRKSILLKVGITGGAVAVLTVVALAVGAAKGAPQAALFVLIPGAIVFALVAYFSTRGYKSDFKRAVIEPIVKFIDPGLHYSPERCIGEGTFKASRLFEQRIDRYRGEDRVSGTLDKTEVQFSEVHAEYKTTTTNSKGHTQTHWHTIFKGLFFAADFNKDFKGTTVLVPDVAERMLGGWLGKLFQSMNFARTGELIKLENPEFEKFFAVYGDDLVEARYILSPSLMERIVEFRKRPETGNNVFISFARSSVYVAVPTSRDMFEPRIFRTLLDFKMIREYYLDFTLATGIVEDMNLNTRIWTKE